MGNCRSKTSAAAPPQPADPVLPTPEKKEDEKLSGDSTTALIDAFLPGVLSSVRRALSKTLTEKGFILRNEKAVTAFDEDGPDDDLPFRPISVDIGSVHVVIPKALRNDMDADPDFEWPEADRVEELMHKVPEGEAGMVVLDLLDVDVKIRFEDGAEVSLPAKGPMGLKGDLEVGAGDGVDEAWVKMEKAKLRVWIVNATGRLFIAFMDRPAKLVPHFHVNLDRGRGDFKGKVYQESDPNVDNALLSLMSDFGPNTMKSNKEENKKSFLKVDMMEGIWDSAVKNLASAGGRRPMAVGIPFGKPKPSKEDDDSTAALLDAFLPIVLPVVRGALSKNLIDQGSVLRDEKPVTIFDERHLPIRPLDVQIGCLQVVSPKELRRDMDAMPKFQWPERDCVEERMKRRPGGGSDMIVLDLEDVNVEVRFDKGVELTFPVEGPMGMSANLEMGAGGSIDEAFFQLKKLRVRIWFINKTGKVYVAFMERPDIVPHIQVNVDRGRGDFLGTEFTEQGSTLDDMVERILMGFGPIQEHKRSHTSLIGDGMGKMLSSALGTFLKMGNGRPLELDVQEQIQSTIDLAMGIPRSVELIEADIELLQKELEASKKINDLEEVPTDEETVSDNEAAADPANDTNSMGNWLCGSIPCMG